ncbi:MAG: NADH-quinone oxidoreductase subunit C [bacterium]|nr:NADH-quinone oxidoreductase subunit C [bacterium]
MMNEKIQQYIPKNTKAELHGNAAVFEVSASEIATVVGDLRNHSHLALKLITATDERKDRGCFKIWYILGVPKENVFIVPFIVLKNTNEFPSIVSVVHEAFEYEKKIRTFFGLTPTDHPDGRPTILHENWPVDVFPLRKDFIWNARPELAHGAYQFEEVKGDGIYEIPVGPIHAGIIEPGHFRFSVAGERIVLLEPRLGFVHKGTEKLFETLSLVEKVRLSEKVSGDSSFSHSLAFCQALEKLGNIVVPKRALYLRVLYAELERLANHFGDIGAIMIDTGFNFGGSHGARLREMIMRIHEGLTGSRFLRGVNVLGGVTKDIGDREKNTLSGNLAKIAKDFSEIIEIAENSVTLLNRLKETGTLSCEIAQDRGVMGVVGKAVGISSDARIDYPYAVYDEALIGEVAIEHDGDVRARFLVRVKEVHASVGIIQNMLRRLPEGPVHASISDISFEKNSFAVSIVEGWRGEIVYFIATDKDGNISRVVPRDPSCVNWPVIGDAGFDNVVPDFPLINKSFNMSYSGNDL